MRRLLEKYLFNKVLLLENLYLYDGQVPKSVRDSFDISGPTYKRYEEEIHSRYYESRSNSMIYNVPSFIEIYADFVQESVKLQLLKKLFLFPGEKSQFYKELLGVSDASFSRVLNQLKGDLQQLKMEIVVKNGYRIVSKEKHELPIFFSLMIRGFCWPIEEFEEQVAANFSRQRLEALQAIDFKLFTLHANESDLDYFYITSLCFHLCESYRSELEDVSDEECAEGIVSLWCTAMATANSTIYMEQSALYNLYTKYGVLPEKWGFTQHLLTLILMHVRLFPYTLESIPIRDTLFVHKLERSFPLRVHQLKSFVDEVAEIVNEDAFHRYNPLIYQLVTHGAIGRMNTTAYTVYIYSSMGKSHQMYLYHQLKSLLQYDGQYIKIRLFDPSDSHNGVNEFLITTNKLSSFKKEKQFLISDYLSFSEYLQFNVWLKDIIRRDTNKDE